MLKYEVIIYWRGGDDAFIAEARCVRLHDLQHLNVSIRRKPQQDAKLSADQIGHTDPAFTTRLYAHLFQEDRQGAAVNLTAWLPKSAEKN